MTDKPLLRARLRAIRDAMAGAPPVPPPRAFTQRLAERPVIATYAPVGGEADPAPFNAAARAAGCRLALPHVTDRAVPMRFLAWFEHDALVPGAFGLRQPAHDSPELTPDIVLAPLLGFDRRGNRLGHGAGYYDRAFAMLPNAWRIGIAWSAQEVDALDPDPWDVPLHAIATEREWIVAA